MRDSQKKGNIYLLGFHAGLLCNWDSMDCTDEHIKL